MRPERLIPGDETVLRFSEMRRCITESVYYLSIGFPCIVSCWTLCGNGSLSTAAKALLTSLTVACVGFTALLRHLSRLENETQRMIAREQRDRIHFLQCHMQPTVQMIRDVAACIVEEMESAGLANQCDMSTRTYAAVAAFPKDGAITNIRRFARIEDYEIAAFFGSGEDDISRLVHSYLYDGKPLESKGADGAAADYRKVGRFITGISSLLYGSASKFFFDENEHKIWIPANDAVAEDVVFCGQQLQDLSGLCRMDAWSRIIGHFSDLGFKTLPEAEKRTPEGRWI